MTLADIAPPPSSDSPGGLSCSALAVLLIASLVIVAVRLTRRRRAQAGAPVDKGGPR